MQRIDISLCTRIGEVRGMTMWKFKGCPRCRGDMFLERDQSAWYEKCLQCSYQHELRSMSEFQVQLTQTESELALA